MLKPTQTHFLSVCLSVSPAANESQALQDVQALRAALRPPLPVAGELRGGEEPPLVRGVPAGAAAGAAVGSAHGSVRPSAAQMSVCGLTSFQEQTAFCQE